MTARHLSASESWGRTGRPAGELLKPYREHGIVRLAPYERFYTWTTGSGHWRLLVVNERIEVEVVGPEFESKTEALLALPALARLHGCRRAR